MKKYEIDYTDFDPDKEYEIKNSRIKQTHNQIVSDQYRGIQLSKYLESLSDEELAMRCKPLIEGAVNWREQHPEEAEEIARRGGIASFEKNVGIFKYSKEERIQHLIEGATFESRGRGGKKAIIKAREKLTTEKCSLGGKNGGKKSSSIERICPYCGTPGKGNSIFRWHFENCKKKPAL